MTNLAKKKGTGFEYEVRDFFRKYFPWLKRKPERMIMSGAAEGLKSDINFFGELSLKVECKRQEKLNLNKWIEQAKGQIDAGEQWMLAFRRSNERSFAVMDLEMAVMMLATYYKEVPEVNKKIRAKVKIDNDELPFSKSWQLSKK